MHSRGSINPAIQGLRGVAILLVLLNHAGVPGFRGGYVGVDIFFVISGYLIGGLLTEEVGRTRSVDLLSFYARRMRRLFPASLLLLLFVMGMGAWLYAPIEHGELFSSARAAALYLVNLWFTTRAVDYFGGHADANPLLHLWSLAVEEQFYAVFPMLIWALAKGGMQSRRSHFGWAAGLVVVSFAACVLTTWWSQPLAFFGMPWRVWEFALGWLLFLGRGSTARIRLGALSMLGGMAWVLLIWVTLFFHEKLLFPGAWAALPAAAAMGLLAVAGDPRVVLASRALCSRGLQWLGNCSYSLYLWHWPLILFVHQLWPQSGGWERVAAIALSLLVGQASYRWIENPARQRLFPKMQATGIVSLGILACALVAALATGMPAAFSHAQDAKLLQARSEKPAPQHLGCHARYDGLDLPDCHFGKIGAERRVVVFGDSHALQWFPAFERVALSNGWQLTSLTKSGCSALDVPVWLDALRRDYWECTRWRASMLSRMAAMKPDLVVLATVMPHQLPVPVWTNALDARLRAWQQSGQAVVMLRDTPKLDFDVPGCLARAHWRGSDGAAACRFSRADPEVWHSALVDAESQVLKNLGIPRLDLSSAICDRERCATEINGKAIYSDDNHLSVMFAVDLAPALERELKAIAATPQGQRIGALLSP